ncbi:MAG: hypothetical protein LBS89_02330 [Zoogloeaceae bacterium]|jgi:hypothetical protein|nr:hypothetical protein [Zoogloeaceae bacterium]
MSEKDFQQKNGKIKMVSDLRAESKRRFVSIATWHYHGGTLQFSFFGMHAT